MSEPDERASATEAFFSRVHREVFRGDPAANPRLKVEVVASAMAEDTPMLILIAPWTMNGMAFPPDGRFTNSLTVGARDYPVFANEVPELGRYFSVNLVGDVSSLKSPSEARTAASALAAPYTEAVAAVRRELTVPDPSRRALFRSFGSES